VHALRLRQCKNFVAILLLSQGVPMLLAGDELLRTQRGNNNAYCQDNEISWLDWGLAERNGEMLRFVRGMVALRRRHPSLRRERFLTGRPAPGSPMPDICWHGERLHEPPWGASDARLLAFSLAGLGADEPALHVVLNMSEESRTVELPSLAGRAWHLAVDTAQPSPADLTEPADQRPIGAERCTAQARSVVVLESRPRP
jgi:glycogen operon protein